MNVLAGIKQTRNRILKQYTVADIMATDDWSLEQSLDTAWNRAKLMESLERLDEEKDAIVRG
ncbi:MAG: tRNA (guanine-N1)-methyltransferase [Ligilactobacillus ruminis]